MATIGQATDLQPKVIADAAEWYAAERQRNNIPRPFVGVDPAVLKTAWRLSNGQWQRCLTDGDGSVIVCKKAVWQ